MVQLRYGGSEGERGCSGEYNSPWEFCSNRGLTPRAKVVQPRFQKRRRGRGTMINNLISFSPNWSRGTRRCVSSSRISTIIHSDIFLLSFVFTIIRRLPLTSSPWSHSWLIMPLNREDCQYVNLPLHLNLFHRPDTMMYDECSNDYVSMSICRTDIR
jgi:hypothetical protein